MFNDLIRRALQHIAQATPQLATLADKETLSGSVSVSSETVWWIPIKEQLFDPIRGQAATRYHIEAVQMVRDHRGEWTVVSSTLLPPVPVDAESERAFRLLS